MTATKEVAAKRKTLGELLNDSETQKRFEGMLGKDARSFMQNILTVYNGSKLLQQCDPESIIAACAISASINLSILPSIGHSCIVPYKEKDGSGGERLVATWQIQWKGIVQLAHRSAQYRRINLAHVYEGQLVSYDEFKGVVHLRSEKTSDRVQGYYFFFELLNGLQMEFYWSAKKCVEHGLRYSKSFQKGSGKWTEDAEFEKSKNVNAWLAGNEHFLTEGSGADAMSAKTIVKVSLNKWGPLETRVKEIIALDQAVIGNDGTPKYIDTTSEPAAEPKTYATPPESKKDESNDAQAIAWVRAEAIKKGIPADQFDAWLAQNDGDEAAKATAAKEAWKHVVAKEAATDVFYVYNAKVTFGKLSFKVYSVATTEFFGEDAFVIKSAGEDIKHFTQDEKVYEAAKAAKKSDSVFEINYREIEREGKTYRWIVSIA